MNTQEDKPLLAKARGQPESATSSNGFSRASKMAAGAAGLLLAGAGTLSAARANQAYHLGAGTASSNVVTLTLGCSPTDLLSLLPFEPKSWDSSRVGVKFVSSSMSKTFEFSKAKEMVATSQCGVYQLPYQLSQNSKFGFYLYEKGNPSNHMSDIGAQVKGGPVSDASIRAAGWLNDKNAAAKHTIDIEDMRKAAKKDAVDSDAAAKRIAEKTFHTKTETVTKRNAAPTGNEVVSNLGLVETRTYSNFNGNARVTSDTIACDGVKKTCTLKSCVGPECTEYTKHDCAAGMPGCKVSADFKNPADVSVRTTETKKFFQTTMSPQEKTREQNRDMIEKAQRDLGTTVEVLPTRRRLLSKIFDIKNSVTTSLPEMGYGQSHPTRVIKYMASCTTKHVTEEAEFFPRVHDASNPGNTYVFGSCFNNRDQQTCKLPTEVLAPGCPGSSATLAKSVTNPITTKTAAASLSGDSANHLTNENIQMEVAKCLGDDPIQGDCPKQKFGKISSWDVSRVTDMTQLFDHPPLKNKNDRYSSFNGDLGNWDVSHVTDMKLMFSRALAYEGKNINKWDTKNVENMSGMFKHADRFNAMISGWNTAKVKKMNVMFQNAFAFDQDISRWDVSQVHDFTRMFAGTFDKGFGQDISGWNVKPHARQVDMFFEAYNFQSKFVCDHVDHGPVNSCVGASASVGKTESELKEMAEKKAAEDEADDDIDVEEKESFFGRFKHWLQN